jgi:hypothetical protein
MGMLSSVSSGQETANDLSLPLFWLTINLFPYVLLEHTAKKPSHLTVKSILPQKFH